MRPAGQTRMTQTGGLPPPVRDEIAGVFLADEVELVAKLGRSAKATPQERRDVADLASRFVSASGGHRDPREEPRALPRRRCSGPEARLRRKDRSGSGS